MMTKWYIKEISKLTNISVRMLRHYDKIGLLKPSFREANGYRCYNRQDLEKLEQIVALKYLGLNLNTIKDILQKDHTVYAHLQAQQQMIKEQKIHLESLCNILDDILQNISPSDPPEWLKIIQLIKGYNMNETIREQLEKNWAGKNLTSSQFEDYLYLYEQFPEEFKKRDEIIQRINQKTVGDPDGNEGEEIMSFLIDLARKMKFLFSKQVELGSSLLKSIQSGKLTQLELNPEGMVWLHRANSGYWLRRWEKLYEKIANHIDTPPQTQVGKEMAEEWRALIDSYLLIGNPDYLTGTLLWQYMARQHHDFNTMKPSSPQDMIQPYYIKLIFNPEVACWISEALEVHTA